MFPEHKPTSLSDIQRKQLATANAEMQVFTSNETHAYIVSERQIMVIRKIPIAHVTTVYILWTQYWIGLGSGT